MASLRPRPLTSNFPRSLNKRALLLFSDSAERLGRLRASLAGGAIEIHAVSSLEELQGECASQHALAVIDANPTHLPKVLDMIRASREHHDIPLLVETSHCPQQPAAGLLPKYRAMPCGLRELVALAQLGNDLTEHSLKPIL
jgi:hypothetical protein